MDSHAVEGKYQARPQKDIQSRPETLWWKLDPSRPGERVYLFQPLPTLPHLGIIKGKEERGGRESGGLDDMSRSHITTTNNNNNNHLKSSSPQVPSMLMCQMSLSGFEP